MNYVYTRYSACKYILLNHHR